MGSYRGVECIAPHFVTNGGAGLRWSILYFSNSDLINPTTITRITFRDSDGDPVSDTVHGSHPPGVGGTTISPVLPGGARTLTTPSVFDPPNFGNIPGGFAKGLPMTVVVEWSKNGDAARFFVRGVSVASKRIKNSGGTVTFADRLAHNFLPCFKLDD